MVQAEIYVAVVVCNATVCYHPTHKTNNKIKIKKASLHWCYFPLAKTSIYLSQIVLCGKYAASSGTSGLIKKSMAMNLVQYGHYRRGDAPENA